LPTPASRDESCGIPEQGSCSSRSSRAPKRRAQLRLTGDHHATPPCTPRVTLPAAATGARVRARVWRLLPLPIMARHWWNERDPGVWDRVKEALRRDWEQTKFDLNLGGHQLNQTMKATLDQVSGEALVPPIDRPNPPKIIAEWDDVQLPIEYGYVARRFFGVEYPEWSAALERRLERDWHGTMPWKDAKLFVRHGYDLKD
jgi:hypothetical protein